ncbi:MAG: RNA ligase family protein [Lachnospiraceae bacterium]|nr:RNA ligase family protein [Lachnospiraceae bacterium]
MMDQKRYMEIERLRDDFKTGFRTGDLVQISEKIDGSNGAIQYDLMTDTLAAFSRNKRLNEKNRLSGFWDYVQSLCAEDYKDTPDYVIFGEWLTQNIIVYKQENIKRWYVFDIYDRKEMRYLPQTEVRQFAESHNLLYAHVFYEGAFISWEHVKSFVGKSAYGDLGEGVVIKNQTRLNSRDKDHPFVVKLVRKDLQEVKRARKQRRADPVDELLAVREIVESVVTRQRVEKELYKMRDDGILPEDWKSWNIKMIAQNLPKRIYLDCVKEERETVKEAGEYFGKICSAMAMGYAREILEEQKKGCLAE